jgi:hypothetical protein
MPINIFSDVRSGARDAGVMAEEAGVTMLKVTRRRKLEGLRDLSAHEDRALRDAFGRWPEPGARAAGAAVVQAYQRVGAGHWFACDCLTSAPPPALVPVLESYIRRHHEPPWPEHDPDCDFFRDHLEQRTITRTFSRRLGNRRISLLARLAESQDEPKPRVTGRSYARSRGALATSLMQLVETAQLNVMSPEGKAPGIAEQYKAIRLAARDVQIDERVRLSDYLCTYLPALPELMAKIAGTPPGRFAITRRPHGLMIFMASDAASGSVLPLRGEPIPIRGEIAIFGEREGHSRQTTEERRLRSPYLATCVVGRASPDSAVEVLKAYLHPCAAPGHLMPVDSDLERRTLARLVQLQGWLRQRTGIEVTIKKPVFGLGDASDDHAEAPEEQIGPFIPDFLLRAERVPEGGARTVVVETMGYADAVYRRRKIRTQTQMSALLGDAPVIHHDFHQPQGHSQEIRDRRFWLDCRWTITGKNASERLKLDPEHF